jgi:hypothetical protein
LIFQYQASIHECGSVISSGARRIKAKLIAFSLTDRLEEQGPAHGQPQ